MKAALDIILAKQPISAIIFSDSRSALDAVTKYAPPNRLIQSIQQKIHELLASGLSIELCWIPAHVGIHGNECADAAAKEACSQIISHNYVPVCDWVSSVRPLLYQDWQSLWESQPLTNKLRNIKPNVHPWLSTSQKSRHAEVILTRLRIGHTRFSHGHLMSSPHAPQLVCSDCQTPMSVQHLLIECPKYNHLRQIHLRKNTMSGILAENPQFSIAALLSFLTKTNFLLKI